LELRLGAKFFLGLWPLRGIGVHLAEFEVKAWEIGANTQGFLKFPFGLGHLAQDEIVFRESLVGARGIGMGGDQGIDGILG
jgi:hypothetical protein